MILKQKVDEISKMVEVVTKEAVYEDVDADVFETIASSSSNHISGGYMILSGISEAEARKLVEVSGSSSIRCNGFTYKRTKTTKVIWKGSNFRLLRDGRVTLLRCNSSIGFIGAIFHDNKDVVLSVNQSNWEVKLRVA